MKTIFTVDHLMVKAKKTQAAEYSIFKIAKA